MNRVKLTVHGIVQGVGFRPFVYNLACGFNLSGFVYNNTTGVVIEIQGETSTINRFIKELRDKTPEISSIKNIQKENLPVIPQEKDFLIKKSETHYEKFVFVAYDLSICSDCFNELFEKNNRRLLYPFINCTNCGPRYTITKNIPYDRKNTTMKSFEMCPDCLKEYNNPSDRRFHAQPNACFACGPKIALGRQKKDMNFKTLTTRTIEGFLEKSADLISQGKIIAIKGIGGYHIACDASIIPTVKLLREKKKRSTKPFALMADNLQTIENICFINKKEKELLLSPRRPIVLLEIKKQTEWMKAAAPNQRFLGIMLAYAPLHYLLFDSLKRRQPNPILIMTSANLKDFPLIKDESRIFKLKNFVSYVLAHNRPIHTACDDSISRVYNNKEYSIRKARGYTPDFFEFSVKQPVLGCGAELKSCFSITKNNYLITSQYIGDLKNYPNYRFFLETLAHFKKIFDFNPQVVAYDLHPGYLSSQYAVSLNNVTKIPVQHHYAHAASCMLEHNLNQKVIGVIFDGTGLGSDGKIWGGEFLVCDTQGFRRAAHFDYFGLLGADKAVQEPFRTAVYILYDIFKNQFDSLDINFTRRIPEKTKRLLVSLIKSKNYVSCSSAGRLFDATASLLGLKDEITYEAEAAILLEMLAYKYKGKKVTPYTFEIRKGNIIRINWQPLFAEIITDITAKKDKSLIAYKFHYTLACIITETCRQLRVKYNLNKIVLSGGVFQNWLLLTLSTGLLRKNKFQVYTHSRFPCNDSCISSGQAAIAGWQINKTF